jgi:hypothetical protein
MVTTQYAKALPHYRVNAVDPGYTATDLKRHSGYKTVEDGASIMVEMALVPPDGPTGGFFNDTGPCRGELPLLGTQRPRLASTRPGPWSTTVIPERGLGNPSR